MKISLPKWLQGVIAVATAIGLLFAAIKWGTDRNAFYDFLDTSFKSTKYFIFFLCSLIAFVTASCISIIAVRPRIGFRQSSNSIKRIKQRNFIVLAARIVFAILWITSICLVIQQEFKIEKYGVVAGYFGDNKMFAGVLEDSIKGGVNALMPSSPNQFILIEDSRINFGCDTNVSKKIFFRRFEEGAVYSGYFDIAAQFISLDIRWLKNNNSSCLPINTYKDRIAKCTCDVYANADMMSNFILGFICINLCKFEQATVYISNVRQQIDTISDIVIKKRLIKLKKITDDYMAIAASMVSARDENNSFLKSFKEIAEDSLGYIQNKIGSFYLPYWASIYKNGLIKGEHYFLILDDTVIALYKQNIKNDTEYYFIKGISNSSHYMSFINYKTMSSLTRLEQELRKLIAIDKYVRYKSSHLFKH